MNNQFLILSFKLNFLFVFFFIFISVTKYSLHTVHCGIPLQWRITAANTMWVQLQLHYKILIFNSNKSSEGEILFTVPQYTPLTENRYYISLYVIFSKYTVRGQMDELNDTQ